jgi:hypothetical protein
VTDEFMLGIELHQVVANALGVSHVWHSDHNDKVLAAVRELLAKPVATREAVREWLIPRIERETMGVSTDLVLAAIAHFSPPAPAVDVPSVEEIKADMRKTLNISTGHGMGILVSDAARVAHALLEKHARPRMEIDGMTVDHIKAVICRYSAPSKSAAEIHRLATTPAQDDPDKEAKALCWEFEQRINPGEYDDAEKAWDDYTPLGQDGWRAVAAKAKS